MLSSGEITKVFNQKWHDDHTQTWGKMRWLGVRIAKTPCDLWMYQELITSIKPDWILETGTFYGGSALFMAHICGLLGHGQVITIDIKRRQHSIKHPRLEFLIGHSTAIKTLKYLHRKVDGKVMVVLDSDHHKKHVLKELHLYSEFICPGSYLIIEDTNINSTIYLDYGPGLKEAVEEFLSKNDRFVIDQDCERYRLTFNPGGYLKCVR